MVLVCVYHASVSRHIVWMLCYKHVVCVFYVGGGGHVCHVLDVNVSGQHVACTCVYHVVPADTCGYCDGVIGNVYVCFARQRQRTCIHV